MEVPADLGFGWDSDVVGWVVVVGQLGHWLDLATDESEGRVHGWLNLARL